MFALFCDVKSHLDRFPKISKYHKKSQPPCLILWGKKDTFFEIEEIVAFNRELDAVETYILNGGHFLLESHHHECAGLIATFIANFESEREA